jgi:hypothetical protein
MRAIVLEAADGEPVALREGKRDPGQNLADASQ